MIEIDLEGERVYRVRCRVLPQSRQEFESSDDGSCKMSVGAGFVSTCVQAELGRRSAGERFSMPVTTGLAAFGGHDPALIQTVPLVDSPQDIEAKPSALVACSVDADGFSAGQVLKVNDRQVKVDFNHPMIGKNLRFEVEVLAVMERHG